jgi:hypothetical protein
MFRWGLCDVFKSLQHCYWIFSSSGMLLQRLTTFRRIVAIKHFKKSRSYLTARSLFVLSSSHASVSMLWHVSVTVQAGTFLPHTQFLVIRDLFNLCCQPWRYPDIAVLQYATLLDQRLTHVRAVFTVEARYVYCPTRHFPMWERHPAIDHVFTHAIVSSLLAPSM